MLAVLSSGHRHSGRFIACFLGEILSRFRVAKGLGPLHLFSLNLRMMLRVISLSRLERRNRAEIGVITVL